MKRSFLRRMAWLTLFSVSAGLVAPSAALASATPPPATEAKADITTKVATKLYSAMRGVLQKTLAAASRTDRLNLKLNFSFLDDEKRMLFDISGIAKVKVRSDKRRAAFAKQMKDEKTKVLSTNGPLSLDLAASPIAIEGEDVVFAVHLDITVLTRAVFQKLIRTGAQIVGVIGINALASQALDALAGFSSDTAGKALELGVENMSALVSGETGAVAYATFQDDEHKTWKEKLKATATPGGLAKHFAMAVIFAATTGGMKAVGGTLGAAVGAALIPGGGSFIATIAATSALVWFGNYAVQTVGVKWPVLWRLSKIGRLYRKAVDSEGSRRQSLSAKYGKYCDKILTKVNQEIDGRYKRWVFLELLIRYFRKRVLKQGELANNLESFDLAPYQRLIDGIAQKLQFHMQEDKDWYAGRMYFQLKEAVNQLPEGYDHRPNPSEIIEDLGGKPGTRVEHRSAE